MQPEADFFRALEAERTQALVVRDMPTIERLHAAGYELISPPGRVMSRERYLSLLHAGPFYAAWDHGSMRVLQSSGMAAVRYQAKITFPSGNVVDCWHTDLYVCDLLSGRWQAVWSQATRLPPPDPLPLQITPAVASDAAECVHLRGLTRENAISETQLRAQGVTVESWAAEIATHRLPGWVARRGQQLVGYCFGAPDSGEVVVLALLAQEEGQGLGRQLLARVVEFLARQGHTRLFLSCAADPTVRSHGFYRHLGWKPARGGIDAHGDEVLEFHIGSASAAASDA